MTLSQIAQIVTNLEHFQIACTELQRSLTSLRYELTTASPPPDPHPLEPCRSARRGGAITLTASASLGATLSRALERITSLITSKLDDFFELSEYDWTPKTREDAPSMYLYELINWLTTVVDSLVVKDAYKDEAYKGAVSYIADCLIVSAPPSSENPVRRLDIPITPMA